jgi:hypothetical protein
MCRVHRASRDKGAPWKRANSWLERVRTIQVHTWEGIIDVFPQHCSAAPANEALDDIGDFLRQQFSMSVGQTVDQSDER